MVQDQKPCRAGEPQGPPWPAVLFQQSVEKPREILALAKRWKSKDCRIEPVIEVFAERAGGDHIRERPVRGGHDSEIDLARLRATDGQNFAFGQNAQQPALRGKGHVADFIEKERAALGLFDQPLASLGKSAGKGAGV